VQQSPTSELLQELAEKLKQIQMSANARSSKENNPTNSSKLPENTTTKPLNNSFARPAAKSQATVQASPPMQPYVMHQMPPPAIAQDNILNAAINPLLPVPPQV